MCRICIAFLNSNKFELTQNQTCKYTFGITLRFMAMMASMCRETMTSSYIVVPLS